MNTFVSLARGRQLCAAVLVVGSLGAAVWQFLPGVPVMWAPWASESARAAGKDLFVHEWEPNDPLAGGDGLGPVFNARSCAACHFQGGIGGGGPNQHNVTSFEVMPTKSNPHLGGGVIHSFAVSLPDQESFDKVRDIHPIIKGETRQAGTRECPYTIVIPDFDPVRTETVNTTALFGAGWIDRIPGKSIQANRLTRAVAGTLKEFTLDFNSIPPGRPHILPDGRVGKFGWKAQFATLKEFVAAACANELGLSNPLMDQPRPLGKTDSPAANPDLDAKQFANLVAFVDTIPRPVEVLPTDSEGQVQATRGKQLFNQVGCAVCHTPDLGGVQGVYSDFLLHSVESSGPSGPSNYDQGRDPPVPLPGNHPKPSEWKTPPLWGVADSAPYFHDGGATTLRAAILRHGSDAAVVTEAYKNLSPKDQEAVIAFLKTLKAPEVEPAAGNAVVKR
jgi:mono/diheme cytochrome c family protein